MVYNFQKIDEEFEKFIYSQKIGNDDKFIKLNERDYYRDISTNTICHFKNCDKIAIKSHTYPISFLKKISPNGVIYSTDIRRVVENAYEDSPVDVVYKSHINKSGVQNLFCEKHDSQLFERLEIKPLVDSTDIETYLSLFLYRFFIYDFELETEVHFPNKKREINLKKPYAKKIAEEKAIDYLIRQELSTKLISENASYDLSAFLKLKFERIFDSNETPNYSDFEKEFKLEFFDLGFQSKAFISGTMYFNLTQINPTVPSIFGLIPGKDFNTTYFAILIPKESENEMKNYVINIKQSYKEYKNGDETLLGLIVFTLLDASQNIIITESQYNKLNELGQYKDFQKAYLALTMARIPSSPFKAQDLRNYSLQLVEKFSLLK
ncbi:hypothetical protein [Streptococcus salivarius]